MSLRSAFPALAAALLFGASTPLAKLLTGNMSPLLLAGLLYLGSGLGLGALLLLRRWRDLRSGQPPTLLHIPRAEMPWLLGAIVAGGMLGAALFMLCLAQTSAASASLLLNMESILNDAHHRHGHDFAWDEKAPHAHEHRHEALAHSHAHYPDIHHRHPHPH